SAHAAGTAQSVTFAGDDLSYKEVFAIIKKQTGYLVFGNKELFINNKKFSLAVNDEPLVDLLQALLKDQPFDYAIDGKTILISKNQSFPAAAYGRSAMLAYQPPLVIRVLDSSGAPLSGASVSIRNK